MGDGVGRFVGDGVGRFVGCLVGLIDGLQEGLQVGNGVGLFEVEGDFVGSIVTYLWRSMGVNEMRYIFEL